MATFEELLPLSEDELLIEIGKELDRGEAQAFPKPLALLRRRGEEYVIERLEELRSLLCPSGAIRMFADGGFMPELAAAVLALIEKSVTGTEATPIAVLLCKQGISTLCKNEWESIKEDNEGGGE